jgi:hypothetical protein
MENFCYLVIGYCVSSLIAEISHARQTNKLFDRAVCLLESVDANLNDQLKKGESNEKESKTRS